MKKSIIITFLGSFIYFFGVCQQNYYKEVNTQVWKKFYEAFETLNAELMAEIHSAELLRIPANSGKILYYETYIANYHEGFNTAKKNNAKRKIELRFFERINNGKDASERGIYKLTLIDGSGKQSFYYGQFHVILKKHNGIWKIFMDYDSNKGNIIDETEFREAKAIDDYNF